MRALHTRPAPRLATRHCPAGLAKDSPGANIRHARQLMAVQSLKQPGIRRNEGVSAPKAVAILVAALASAAPIDRASSAVDQVAAIERYVPPVDLRSRGRSDPLVERIQQGLIRAGIYSGLVDGILGDATEEAIRTYQQRNDLAVDGRISENLAIHLETAVGVKGLLQRLEQSRQEDVESARQALLSNPATRHLLDDEGASETADAARDPAPCFQNPTARCLLDEAAESAKAIPKDNMRDWALGELLAAQARAGLVDAAMVTVARIDDPRLVMAALREIAESQAAVGRGDDALAATGIIPDRDKRLEALAAIAAIHARRDEPDAVVRAVTGLLAEIADGDSALQRVTLMTRAATALATVGMREEADRILAEAESIARGVDPGQRPGVLRYVAAALAEMGRPDDALAILDDLEVAADKAPVLVAAARALVRSGSHDQALAAADAIEAARYRTIVLCSIAAARAEAGDTDAARALVSRAQVEVADITFPYARAFAMSRIALAHADIGKVDGADSFRRAVAAAQEIGDGQLRAHVLWTLAAERRRAGDGDGATETEALAEIASDDIKSALSRVWMYSEIAVGHLEIGEREAAWAAFRRALFTSEGIDNAWARARALSKVAGTLIEFSGPDGVARTGVMP